MRTTRRVVPGCLALLLAACGTTVSGSQVSGLEADGLSPVAGGPAAATTGAASVVPGGSAPSLEVPATAPVSRPGTAVVASGKPLPASLAPVEIGFFISKNADVLFKAYGFGNL